ncbi:unnamed protein product [Rhizoctonia solani]|uniref:Uncharacterized protein n=1 Tax=Rhizoctonia solani TaxID=456999 RepID=A0A8H3HXC6_9AGAM|nr:unnamed protein product [Rhizoctonia solani]
MPPPSVVRDQSGIPWHIQRYEIYQPPSFVARTPPRYYNFNLLSPHAKERIQWELALACSPLQLPSVVSSASVFPGVGSGIAGGSVRSSLSIRRPSMLASAHLASAGGTVGLETITASLASTDAPLHSPSLDPMNVLNAGPAANHRLSTWLKRPPESPHSSMQPLPSDATDLMDGADPFGGAWHHSSPYDAGEMVIGRRTRDSSISDGSPHTHSIAGPSRKGPSPPSQSTSAINLADEPPGSPDLLSGTLPKRKLSKRWSNSAIRGLSSLFTRKSSVDEDPEGRTGGLRGRSRPPLSPSSHSLTQQGIAFPTTGEKRPRRKRSKRRSRSSSAASVDSSRSIETTIRSQPAGEAPRGVDIVESSKYRRGRKSSVESLNSFINNKNKDHSHSEPARNLRNKIPPHKLLNYVGKDHKSSSIARKLSPTRRRSVDPHPDVTSNPGYNSSKTSFITNRPAAMLARRTTVDLAPSRSSSPMTSQPAEPPEVAQAPPPQVLSSKHERLEQEQLEQGHLEQERLESERLQQEHLERERLQQAERERAERKRIRAAQRQREEQERIERIARERDRERVEMERQERERQEFERERIERERAELVRLEWERMERDRLMEEEIRRREPPALLPTNSGRRIRHEVEGEREIIITSPKGPRKSKRRTPNDSRSTSPTSTAPPPPPKENQPVKSRQRSQTDAYAPPISSALPPPVHQQSVEIIAGVPVLPHGTHVEVAQPFQPRPASVNTIEAPSLKAREAWERERLDKGQSVMVPGGQRAVIPDVGSPRPVPDPRQRQAPSNKGRTQTPLMSHSEPVVPPLSEYGPSHSSYSIPTYPFGRSHNPLPKPPTIDGPFPLHRPGPAYTNPNRRPQGRPSGSRNPLPDPPRV